MSGLHFEPVGCAVSNEQPTVFCNCAKLSGEACLPSCATYDLLYWRVYAPWLHQKRWLDNWTVVQARTAVEAIHATRIGYEPAHDIRCVGRGKNRFRQTNRFHYLVDDNDVIVEELRE